MAAPDPEANAPLSAGPLTVDLAARRAWQADSELALRPKEFDLLARLALDTGAALSRHTLMADVWDEHWHGSTKTLDVHVASLRQRIRSSSRSARLPTITTLRGHGYRLDAPPTDG